MKIELPSLLKNEPSYEVIIMLPKESADINEILNNLIEKTKEIDILKKRIDYLYLYLNIKENKLEPPQFENFINNDLSYKIFDSIHSKIFKSNKEILFLFNHIENSLNKKETIHLGDNFISDYVNPRLIGIHSCLITEK